MVYLVGAHRGETSLINGRPLIIFSFSFILICGEQTTICFGKSLAYIHLYFMAIELKNNNNKTYILRARAHYNYQVKKNRQLLTGHFRKNKQFYFCSVSLFSSAHFYCSQSWNHGRVQTDIMWIQDSFPFHPIHSFCSMFVFFEL